MQGVQGIGGFFFRARDPAALAQWYRDMLGIPLDPSQSGQAPWMAEGGYTVFAPFPDDSAYFERDKPFMLNFRVHDLDSLVARLETAGVSVLWLDDVPGVGRFVHLADPEGTPIELWEPAAVPET